MRPNVRVTCTPRALRGQRGRGDPSVGAKHTLVHCKDYRQRENPPQAVTSSAVFGVPGAGTAGHSLHRSLAWIMEMMILR